MEALRRKLNRVGIAAHPWSGPAGRHLSKQAVKRPPGVAYPGGGPSRPSAVSRTACSSARNGARSSAERRATKPER